MSSASGGDITQYINGATAPMTAGNYNEMDGLVLSTLSYVHFEDSKVSWTKSELENGITLQEFAQKMLDGGAYDNDDQRALLSSIVNSERYSKCTVTNLAATNGSTMWDAGRTSNISDDAQWAAMTINMNDGTDAEVIAMRGTGGTGDGAGRLGWQEDIELGYETDGTTAQKLSRDYLKASDSEHIFMTGHSKGGNDVSSAYMMNDKSVRDRVVHIDSYDGPGNNAEFVDNFKEGYKELASKQKNYYPENSVVGQLQKDPPGEKIYVSTNTKGHTEIPIMGEHDSFSWEFSSKDHGKLNHTKQSNISKALDTVLDNTLAGMSSYEKTLVMQLLINAGIQNVLDKRDFGELDWKGLIYNIMQQPFTSLDQMWTALRLVRNLISEFSYYGILQLGFHLPGEIEFISWVKEFFADFFRRFKNEAVDYWNNFWNGVNNWINHENNEYHGVHYVDNTPIYNFDDDHQGEYTTNVHVTEKFSVNPDELKTNASQIKTCSDSIRSLANDLVEFKNSLTGIGRILAELPFDVLIVKTRRRAEETETLSDVLNNIANNYQTTEDKIITHITPKGEGY